MAEPEFTKGTGPDAMSQGEVGVLNEAVQAVPSSDPTQRLEGIEWADGTEGDYEPQTEEQAILYGPSEGLRPAIPVGDPNAPVPRNIIRMLPLLQRAAMDPQAPPALVATVRLIERKLATGA